MLLMKNLWNIITNTLSALDNLPSNHCIHNQTERLRVNRLRTSILSDSISDIGKFNVIERLVDLNADRKRLWFESLQNVNDRIMIDSMPISLNYIEKNLSNSSYQMSMKIKK